MAKMTAEEIKQNLTRLPRWGWNGDRISRTFRFKDFSEAMKFVNQVAEAAEAARHHPDIDIRWNRVRLQLTTHDDGGLTGKDFDLAAKFDAFD